MAARRDETQAPSSATVTPMPDAIDSGIHWLGGSSFIGENSVPAASSSIGGVNAYASSDPAKAAATAIVSASPKIMRRT